MPSWREVESEAPDLAALARGCFDSHKHKVLATLRRDGSPRVSGTELNFRDGELWFGSMWKAVKALDLRRDPRFAVHSAPGEDLPDAKLAGSAEEITDPALVESINQGEGRSHLFRTDITELVVTRIGDPPDHLVIESWHAGRGASRRKRR